VFSPYGNAHGGIVPSAREIDLASVGGGAALGDGMMGCPTGILLVAKLILRRSSMRDSVSASGGGAPERARRDPSRGDGGNCAGHDVAWLHEPGENGGTDVALP
jgi:hypothetical protein